MKQPYLKSKWMGLSSFKSWVLKFLFTFILIMQYLIRTIHTIKIPAEPRDIFVYDSTLVYILLQDRVIKKDKLKDNLWKTNPSYLTKP